MTHARLVARLLAILAHHAIEWPYSAESTQVKRTRAGYDQRAKGAWSWWLATTDTPHCPQIGSPYSATELARLAPDQTKKYSPSFARDTIELHPSANW